MSPSGSASDCPRPAAPAAWSAIPAQAGGAGSSRATAAAASGRQGEAKAFLQIVPVWAGTIVHSKSESTDRARSARRQNHHDLAALETRVLLDFGELRDVAFDLVQKLGADFLMRHFTATVAQGDLDLVALFEEALHGTHLHIIVVVVDHRPELDLLDLDDLLLFAGFSRFLLRRILELPVVHDLANGRNGIGRDFHEVHAGFERHLDGDDRLDRALVGAVLIDQLDLCVADFIIGTRPVFGSSGRSSVGTANGYFSKVVNEDCSLKDKRLAGKPTSHSSDKKHQMR